VLEICEGYTRLLLHRSVKALFRVRIYHVEVFYFPDCIGHSGDRLPIDQVCGALHFPHVHLSQDREHHCSIGLSIQALEGQVHITREDYFAAIEIRREHISEWIRDFKDHGRIQKRDRRCDRSVAGFRPKTDMADSGSMLIDVLFHLLNDFDVVSVTATTHAKFGNRGRGEGTWGKSEVDPKRTFDVEDHSTAFIRMKKGYTVTVETSWAGFHPGDNREEGIDLLGTEAGMSLFPAKLFKQSLQGFETTHFYNVKNGPVEDRISHFVNCIVEGKKPLIPIEESLKVQQIMDAIYTSAETGKEVRLGGK
jgi:hypothetical protein